ncbi:MAG: enoyl-CoA hydratase/isomerase family protein [Actinomycetota bacterium]
MTEPEVLFERRGPLGHIILNRPKSINALTTGMVLAIQPQLDAWATDDSIDTVLITGAGERGLCAGGDIVSMYNDAKSGQIERSAFFLRNEYRLNSTIANYAKPYVAIMDGIVLGGGIGLSAHGSHRVVTERSKLGMPETGIGFFPDVGGTWLLSHTPGELGTHLALTGGSIGAGDAIAIGLADYFVPSNAIPALIVALEHTDAGSAIAAAATAAPDSPLAARRAFLDEAYSAPTAVEIVEWLGADPVAAEILSKSPTAVTVTLEALRRGRVMGSLEEALSQEYRMALTAFSAPDFVEGVRAQVIDKDRRPKWSPATLGEVRPEAVAAYFEPIGADELDLTR